MSSADEDSSSSFEQDYPLADVGILNTVPLLKTVTTTLLAQRDTEKNSAPRLGLVDHRFVPYDESPIQLPTHLSPTPAIPSLKLAECAQTDASWLPFNTSDEMRKSRKRQAKSLEREARERVDNTITSLAQGKSRFIGYQTAPYYFRSLQRRLQSGESIYLTCPADCDCTTGVCTLKGAMQLFTERIAERTRRRCELRDEPIPKALQTTSFSSLYPSLSSGASSSSSSANGDADVRAHGNASEPCRLCSNVVCLSALDLWPVLCEEDIQTMVATVEARSAAIEEEDEGENEENQANMDKLAFRRSLCILSRNTCIDKTSNELPKRVCKYSIVEQAFGWLLNRCRQLDMQLKTLSEAQAIAEAEKSRTLESEDKNKKNDSSADVSAEMSLSHQDKKAHKTLDANAACISTSVQQRVEDMVDVDAAAVVQPQHQHMASSQRPSRSQNPPQSQTHVSSSQQHSQPQFPSESSDDERIAQLSQTFTQLPYHAQAHTLPSSQTLLSPAEVTVHATDVPHALAAAASVVNAHSLSTRIPLPSPLASLAGDALPGLGSLPPSLATPLRTALASCHVSAIALLDAVQPRSLAYWQWLVQLGGPTDTLYSTDTVEDTMAEYDSAILSALLRILRTDAPLVTNITVTLRHARVLASMMGIPPLTTPTPAPPAPPALAAGPVPVTDVTSTVARPTAHNDTDTIVDATKTTTNHISGDAARHSVVGVVADDGEESDIVFMVPPSRRKPLGFAPIDTRDIDITRVSARCDNKSMGTDNHLQQQQQQQQPQQQQNVAVAELLDVALQRHLAPLTHVLTRSDAVLCQLAKANGINVSPDTMQTEASAYAAELIRALVSPPVFSPPDAVADTVADTVPLPQSTPAAGRKRGRATTPTTASATTSTSTSTSTTASVSSLASPVGDASVPVPASTRKSARKGATGASAAAEASTTSPNATTTTTATTTTGAGAGVVDADAAVAALLSALDTVQRRGKRARTETSSADDGQVTVALKKPNTATAIPIAVTNATTTATGAAATEAVPAVAVTTNDHLTTGAATSATARDAGHEDQQRREVKEVQVQTNAKQDKDVEKAEEEKEAAVDSSDASEAMLSSSEDDAGSDSSDSDAPGKNNEHIDNNIIGVDADVADKKTSGNADDSTGDSDGEDNQPSEDDASSDSDSDDGKKSKNDDVMHDTDNDAHTHTTNTTTSTPANTSEANTKPTSKATLAETSDSEAVGPVTRSRKESSSDSSDNSENSDESDSESSDGSSYGGNSKATAATKDITPTSTVATASTSDYSSSSESESTFASASTSTHASAATAVSMPQKSGDTVLPSKSTAGGMTDDDGSSNSNSDSDSSDDSGSGSGVVTKRETDTDSDSDSDTSGSECSTTTGTSKLLAATIPSTAKNTNANVAITATAASAAVAVKSNRDDSDSSDSESGSNGSGASTDTDSDPAQTPAPMHSIKPADASSLASPSRARGLFTKRAVPQRITPNMPGVSLLQRSAAGPALTLGRPSVVTAATGTGIASLAIGAKPSNATTAFTASGKASAVAATSAANAGSASTSTPTGSKAAKAMKGSTRGV